jgi:hypothetical protein
MTSTNGPVQPGQTFWLGPPCCLHLSDGAQVREAAKSDVDKILQVGRGNIFNLSVIIYNFYVIFVSNV